MEPHSQTRRKRRRRRKNDRPPISAHLLLDERMKDDVGILSADLVQDLFPGYRNPTGETDKQNSLLHVAIAPWQPHSVVTTSMTAWTIIPVRIPTKPDTLPQRPHSSIQFSATSTALQSFLQALQVVAPGKAFPRKDTPIEIKILDVVPLGLDTIFVSLDTEALKKLDEVQAKFGGGFGGEYSVKAIPSRLGGKGKNVVQKDAKSQESAWRKAVRDALRAPKLVHSGDILPLPLPSHPITHVLAPPARITACEPVSQGLLLPSTRIVIVHSHKHHSTSAKPTIAQITNGIPEEDEDTSNEMFYSAAEERSNSQAPSPPGEESTDDLNSELSVTDQDDLSDDSEDAFTLASPTLPPASGIMSSFQSATPRPGAYSHGISTPGSMFSASTARQGSIRGKQFKAQGLLQKLPDDLLYPKPTAEDDDEARVFVDTSALAKIGCFSGDWVVLESVAVSSSHSLAPWGLNSFDDDQEEPREWRAAKIYGLPESISRKHVKLPTHKMVSRKTSFLDLMGTQSYPTCFASPILLANLGSPTNLRIATLAFQVPDSSKSGSVLQKSRITSSSLPPKAREVTLSKLATPLSLDRALQPSLFTSLKEHFEQKRRIVKTGDMIAIAIDETLGRSVFQITSGEDAPNEEILTKVKGGSSIDHKSAPKVAWFKVDNVTSSAGDDSEENGMWGGAVCVDASNAKMVQAGSDQGRAPSTTDSTWQYYMGVRRAPALPASNLTKAYGAVETPDVQISPLRRRLRELLSASTSPQAIHLGLPPSAILLTSTQRQIGKAFTAERACEDLGLHTFVIDAYDILTEGGAGGGDVKTEAVLRARAERALNCGSEFTVILIKHVDALDAERMTTALKEILGDSRVIIATTTDVEKIPDNIRGLFTHELEMTAPDEGEREGILRGIVQDGGIRLAPEVELASVAIKTAALVAGDLVDVIDRALVAKRTRLEKLAEISTKLAQNDTEITVRDVELAGGLSALSVTKADFDAAVDAARKNFADAIGAPKIPNVGWDDVGGLTHVKDAVMETIQLPLARPELFAKGMKKRSGILFYGPPGTGKTLLAKAIATEFSLNFFSVKGPELLNMYIGESEANVRRVFQRARDARPCVVFFDELDSVAPKRGNQGDSGGVMDRIVSQLLAELDGMSDGDGGGGGVFVIGATNRPDLLDQALLRPGRFDKMLYLGISDTHEKQLTILEALTRKFTLEPSTSLARVSSRLSFTYTGADLYALCSDAMLKAITRAARLVDGKVAAHNKSLPPNSTPITIAHFFDHYATEEDTTVTVAEEDFDAAQRELVPSVSFEELQHYEGVRKAFEGDGTQKAIENTKNASNGKAIDVRKSRPSGKTPAGRRGSNAAQGKGREKALSLSKHQGAVSAVDGGEDDGEADEDEDEDPYLIKTGHLGVNGNGNGNGVYKGKGKGKGSLGFAGQAFGDAAGNDEEELYS
ncbi:AAA-domain-containing protein [Tothia fuscella]|uniref:Peroxisomal ATPase PEX6 n=1 Tax=Tothia fuscella TaxID=1048955 RepID=A0A9P4P2P4_9PEZI|nr:AAA-domain-containing protein [Tothia fuscella]